MIDGKYQAIFALDNRRKPFPGDLMAVYFREGGGIGTYTRPSGESDTWTKQSATAKTATPTQTATATERPNSEADFSVGLTVDGKGVVITGYKGKATTVRIPTTIQGLPVREIGKNAFVGLSTSGSYNTNQSITSVIIPEGVTTIGEGAFFYCESLRTVSLPDTLTSIEQHAFSNCKALDSIKLPASLKKIGYGAFFLSGLTSIGWPAWLTTIPADTFSKTKLRNVSIPEGVTEIEEYAFRDCEDLTSVTLPSSIRKIGSFAFNYCSSLITINIPETVTKIEFRYDVFEGSRKLNLQSQAALRRVGYTGSF